MIQILEMANAGNVDQCNVPFRNKRLRVMVNQEPFIENGTKRSALGRF